MVRRDGIGPGPDRCGADAPPRPGSRGGSATRILALLLLGLPWVLHAADPGGVRRTPLPPPSGDETRRAGFTALPPATLGIDFTNRLPSEKAVQYQNLMNGSGVAAGDINRDGLPDLYFCHRSGTNALYLNLGAGRFTNITAAAGVGCGHQSSSGALLEDLDGDGHVDLFVTAFGGPNAFFRGDGRGGFSPDTERAGLTGRLGATSAAAGDVDRDGDLDLYVCHFGTTSPLRDGAQLSERLVNGVPTITGRWARKVRIVDGKYVEFGEPDVLYLNDGSGGFRPAPWGTTFQSADGPMAEAPWDFGLAVQIRDVNGDGFPDIYVCNDFQTPDRLWLGDGRGRFTEPPPHALRNMSYASMGVDFADIDRDGHLDFVTVEMLSADHAHHLRTSSPMSPVGRVPGLGALREEFARNCLYRARGDGSWEEVACMAGVAATDWSWTPIFLDVDLDGLPDLLVSNGHRHDVNDRDVNERVRSRRATAMRGDRTLLDQYPPLRPPKRAFRNAGGVRFEDAGPEWGFDSDEIAHGMAEADIDGDGDDDVILNCLDGPPLVYRNDARAPRVAVRLAGRPPNTRAIGARVTLTHVGSVQTREVISGGRYLGGGDTALTFAALAGKGRLEIRWPDGRVSHVEDVVAGERIEIRQPETTSDPGAAPGPAAATRPDPAWFEDATDRLGHRHQEDPGTSFADEPLAIRSYGQLAPALVVADVNRDGHPDIAVGGSAGAAVDWLLNDGTGRFRASDNGPRPVLPGDTAGLVWQPGAAAGGRLLARVAAGPSAPPLVEVLPGGGMSDLVVETPPGWTWTPHGPVSGADADGDGRVEYHLGGWLPAAPASDVSDSILWHRVEGRFQPALRCQVSGGAWSRHSSAAWADLDADGLPELITAAEWGDVVICSPGRPEVPALRLGARGWWQGIATADVDGDGRIDVIAGNWGLNSAWSVWGDGRPGAFHGDLEGMGIPGVVEAWRSGPDAPWRPWRSLEVLRAGWPAVAARFGSHAAFATSTVPAILGADAGRAVLTRTDTLASTVFLNRGDRFEPVPLPRAAQVAPVFGISTADFDGDGAVDLFLAQNCFAVRPDDSRLDAGIGLLLRGDGRGGFSPVPAPVSGIRIVGEQRGTAVGDFDSDGRPDLVVAQNGAETRLLLSRRGAPGIRVDIEGPAGNPGGWGGTLRLFAEGRILSTRAISPASGWWSGDQPGALVARPSGATHLEMTWPGGGRTRIQPGPDARRVALRHPDAPASPSPQAAPGPR